jgi:hypothetical protein
VRSRGRRPAGEKHQITNEYKAGSAPYSRSIFRTFMHFFQRPQKYPKARRKLLQVISEDDFKEITGLAAFTIK